MAAQGGGCMSEGGLSDCEGGAATKAVMKRRAAASPSPPLPLKLPCPPSCEAPPKSPTPVLQLPDEVLEIIFSYLSQEDIILRVLPACQRFREVAEDRNLSRRLVLKDDTVPTDIALGLIRTVPKLLSLELNRRDDALALLQAASRCTKLRQFTVMWCSGSAHAISKSLRSVIHSSSHITDICLVKLPVDNGVFFCRDLAISLRDLRIFKINCDWFRAPELNALLDGCPPHQIRELWAPVCPFSDGNIIKLGQRCGRSLQVLELNGLKLTETGLGRLAGCSQLRRIQLLHLDIPGAGLKELAALSLLEELELEYWDGVVVENWAVFFSRSRSASRLRKLSLCESPNVDDSVLCALSNACTCLEELDMSSTSITGAGVREVLQRCRNLQCLKVYDTEASVIQVVHDLPQLAPQLLSIWIGPYARDNLGDAVLNCILAQMPDLEIS